MKKSIFILLFSSLSIVAFSQYDIVSQNGTTIQTCSGTLTSGSYVTGTTYTCTVCSDDELNTHLKYMITSFVFPDGASLCIYDGVSTLSPLLLCVDHTTTSGMVGVQSTVENISGCLTFEFTSSVFGANWTGNLSCQFMCMPREVDIVATIPMLDYDGIVEVCWDDLNDRSMNVVFAAEGIYPEVAYDLNDENVTFVWNFDGEEIIDDPSSNVIIYNFLERKGYSVNVSTIDEYGCVSNNSANVKVHISIPPEFANSATPGQVCLGNEATLCTNLYPSIWEDESSSALGPYSEDTIPIPDGSGVCYELPLLVEGFDIDEIFTSGDNLQNIKINIAHTFIGDLTMFLQCPNGQSVQFQEQGGGGCNLGIPPDIGYLYTIRDIGIPEMDDAASGQTTLPIGEYGSYQSFDALIGCPVNGNWTLRICDNWSADSGTVFGWSLEFDNQIISDPWSYQNEYSVDNWVSPNGSEVLSLYNECANVLVSSVENNLVDSYEVFELGIVDNFGCEHHIPFELLVLNQNHEECTNSIETENIIEQSFIYPNPAIDILYVENGKKIKIYDITSKLIVEFDNNEVIKEIDISTLKLGSYIIEGYFNETFHKVKFIKQ